MKYVPRLLFVLVLFGFPSFPGCAGAHQRITNNEPSATIVVEWDDLDAAVNYAVSQHEWALLASREPGQGFRVYEMVSLTDEPGSITFTRDEATLLVSIDVQIGRFGDPERERDFVATLQDRLRWLIDRD